MGCSIVSGGRSVETGRTGVEEDVAEIGSDRRRNDVKLGCHDRSREVGIET